MAEVILTDVVKVYPGNVTAVDKVSLTIQDREFVVLVGPSGCGKSTTLRMVAGLEDITTGTIQIGDRVVNGVAPKDRDIAMVFQNYALYPHMSVYKNMAFGLLLRRKHGLWDNPLFALLNPGGFRKAREERKAIDERVRGAAEILGITHLLERRPKALSGGQRQRVAVGRAIVRDPKAYLFDEPLSNLDAKLRVEMRSEIKKIHRQVNTTTIYVTHDQEEAMTLGDRVVVMKDGIIQQCDSPLVIYDRPVNRFVASFVGTPPMNFVEGRLEGSGGSLVFDDGHGNQLTPAAAQLDRLAPYAGKPITIGIRPEIMTVANGAVAPGCRFNLGVSVVEPLGDRTDIYGHTPGTPKLVARVGSHAALGVKEGEALSVQIDMDRVHFFEPEEDGRNVSLG
jgi:multiple sugar transport system ATP-binding protein